MTSSSRARAIRYDASSEMQHRRSHAENGFVVQRWLEVRPVPRRDQRMTKQSDVSCTLPFWRSASFFTVEAKLCEVTISLATPEIVVGGSWLTTHGSCKQL